MRTKVVKVLALAAVATACMGAATLTTQETNATTGEVATFQMVDGAGVRMGDTANESAIRFIANVPDLTDKDYRMLIVPTKVLEANDIQASDDVVATLKAEYTTNYETYFLDMEVTPFEDELYGNCVMAAMNGAGSVPEEAGDLLFAIVNVVRLLNLDGEQLLHDATDKFIERFGRMESLAAEDGLDLKTLPLCEQDKYWEKAKKSLFSEKKS